MYKNAMKGDNEAFKLLCIISVMSERKGIIGKNVEFIEKTYNCCVEKFKCMYVDNHMKACGLLIRELSECMSNGHTKKLNLLLNMLHVIDHCQTYVIVIILYNYTYYLYE